MSKFVEPVFPDPIAPTFGQALISSLSACFTVVKAILDHGISFSDNVDCSIVSYTSNAAPNTEDTIAHTLGKTPTHFIITSTDKAASVYLGGTAFTKTNIYLKASVASVSVKLILL